MRYLKETANLCICFHGKQNLIAYSDSDYAGDIDTIKSTSGSIVLLNGGPITWRSKKQTTVATSTVNAEFNAASTACSDIIWCRQFLRELGLELAPTKFLLDNQGAIKSIRNNQCHTKIKHIDVSLYFIREAEQEKQIEVNYIPTDSQPADLQSQ